MQYGHDRYHLTGLLPRWAVRRYLGFSNKNVYFPPLKGLVMCPDAAQYWSRLSADKKSYDNNWWKDNPPPGMSGISLSGSGPAQIYAICAQSLQCVPYAWTTRWTRRPERRTLQLCSRDRAYGKALLADPANGNNYPFRSNYAGYPPSWHGFYGPRPALFFDGHVKIMTAPRYTIINCSDAESGDGGISSVYNNWKNPAHPDYMQPPIVDY